MPFISTTVDNLIGGVSQQPDAIRLPTQCEEQINAYPSVVDGLIKRHPTQHIKKVIDGSAPNLHIHTIDRDASERYVVTISATDIQVFDVTNGTEVHVEDLTGGFGYLTGSTPTQDVRTLTVADFTFIANAAKTTAMSTSTTAADTSLGHAFLFVRQGAFAMDYTVKVVQGATTTNLQTTTWDGTTSIGVLPGAFGTGAIDSVKTEDIAEDLRTQLNAIAGITATRTGSVIELVSASAFDTLEVSDGIGDSALIKVHKEVPRFTDLPEICQDGFKVQISGNAESGTDDFFVVFVGDTSGALTNGHWEETIDYSTEFQFDDTTMPHQLVRRTDDGAGTVTGVPNARYFEFDVVSWDDRLVGDGTLNPDPSFIGKQIQDIFFFKNRLGLLADENLILSAAGQFFSFFRSTVRELLDDDPIDVGVGHTRVSILNHAVPFNERLINFSDRTQFVTGGDRALLTPRTASITAVTEFENYVGAKPVSTARSIFFGFRQGDFSGVREFFQLADTDEFDAVDITAQAPKYIEGEITKIAASTLADMAVFLADGDDSSVWVYKYFWQGQEKIQSAWCRYNFGSSASILNADWIENDLFLLIQRTEGVFLEKMTVGNGVVDSDSEYLTTLDRRIEGPSGSFDPASNTTTYQLSAYDIEPSETMQVVTRDTDSADGGIVLQIDSLDLISNPNKIVVKGDQSSVPVWIGQKYTMEYTFSKPLLKEQTRTGRASVATGRSQILYGILEFSNSGYFRVVVEPTDRDTRTSVFTGAFMGSAQALIGQVNLVSGEHRFPVRTEARRATIKIINDSPLPSNIVSAEWELNFTSRALRFRG